MDLGRALIHEFLSRSSSYYEIKFSTGDDRKSLLYLCGLLRPML